MIIDLIQNAVLIVAFAVVYEQFAEHLARLNRFAPVERLAPVERFAPVATGLLFGIFAFLVMLFPLRFAPGVIHDGRMIVVSIAGFAAGPIAGFVAAIAPVAYRIAVGGIGAFAGVSATVVAAGIGAVFYVLRRRNQRWESWWALVLMAGVVHAAMIAFQLTIPAGVGPALVRETGLVAFALFTVAEVLVARLLLHGEHRRSTAVRLARSEKQYRELFESASVPMLLFDPESQAIVHANAAAARFYGFTEEQLRSRTIADLQAPFSSDGSLRHRLADGTVCDVEIIEGPAISDGERRVLLIVQDVSARRVAERDLHLSRHCIQSASLDVIQVRETDACIMDANDHACSSLGYSREELKNMTVFDIDPTFSYENWRENRDGLRESGMVSFETIRRRKDGSIFPVEVTVTYLEYNGVEYNFSFAQDISERKQAIDEITSSLQQKETLLREVHHRVKNNLAVISGLLSLQMDHVFTMEDAVAGLSKSKERVSAMAEIHSMLYEEKNFGAVDFASYVRRLASTLVTAYQSGPVVDVRFDLENVAVEIDSAVPMALIANELISNAIKHAPADREITVWVRLASEGNTVCLTVEDNGAGMPDGFDAEKTDSLGMQLVRVLSDQVSATLSIENREPGGTRIVVSLPVRPEPSELEAVGAESDSNLT